MTKDLTRGATMRGIGVFALTLVLGNMIKQF